MRKNRFILSMVGKSRKLSIAKYLFVGLLILCVTVVATLLYISDSSTSTEEEIGDINYVRLQLPEFSEDMLDPKFEDCLFNNNDYLARTIETNKHFNSSLFNRSGAIHFNDRKANPLIKTLLEFTELADELELDTFVIEPSLLFCTLSTTVKNLLARRNFTLQNRTSKRVITMGIFHKTVFILEKEDVQTQLAKNGFQIEIVESPTLEWMRSKISVNSSLFPSHVFLQKDKWIIHLVVFYERKKFLWHAAMLSQADTNAPVKENLLFVDSDSAFENFSSISLGFKTPILKFLKIPTNPASFLHQIATSKFLECNKTVVDAFMKQKTVNLSTIHEYSSLSQQQFNQRLLITLEELKSKLEPLLIRFWMWSGTLLGLHRQCDVIPYTSDADFATWATDEEDLNQVTKLFKHNEHLTLKQKLGMVKEGLELKLKCHGLQVDLFFVYKEDNGTWYAGHSPRNGYYFKYHHPNFSLCSAELLGQKVLVPCEAENVIAAEYGPNWMKPVSSWSYEHSIHNRGPNIFFEKRLRRKAYINY